jgi:hypothetical protein
LHRANASVLLVIGLLACGPHRPPAALGWSLGGEAHVFITDDRFARDFHRELTGSRDLMGALEGRSVVAVSVRNGRSATVLSAHGAAPAQLTLARFHAPGTCGFPGVVTELVLAFPPGGGAGRSAPPSHVTVVALLDAPPFAGGAGAPLPALATRDAMSLVRRVSDRAELATRGAPLGLLHPPTLDADEAADAGEVVALRSQYAIGFRTTYVHTVAESRVDTTLITGVATTDTALHELRWVARPQRMRLRGGTIVAASAKARAGARYSLRGAVVGPGGGTLLLLDEIADVALGDSRATAVDAQSRHVLAAQPLALRCP